ncbi:Haloacid dehalogenase-like hydrolase-domain-containing protein [Xylaria intraflava]|nr:Haloacid dehalogenase-like hydrolase-domain-containing protein [Xylaria intraflava]
MSRSCNVIVLLYVTLGGLAPVPNGHVPNGGRLPKKGLLFAGVHQHMAELIHEYFERYLNLSPEAVVDLHSTYYKTYGLQRPELTRLLRDINCSEAKLWLFTNAYVTHDWRMVKIQEIEDIFDGITFCDYTSIPFLSKPEKEMSKKAMLEAGVESMEDRYFVDDNYYNCKMAETIGCNNVHLVEDEARVPEKQASRYQIKDVPTSIPDVIYQDE